MNESLDNKEHAKPQPLSPIWRENEVGWLILARSFIIGPLILFATFTVRDSTNTRLGLATLCAPLIVLYLFSFISLRWRSGHAPSRSFTLTQLCSDVLFVTWAIYLTGGPLSPFLFLYLPVVMAAAVLRSRVEALSITSLIGVLYSSLSALMITGNLPALSLDATSLVPPGGALVQILGLVSAMSLVAIGTSYLVHKIKAGNLLVERSQDHISELTTRHRELFDQIPEGVITTDLDDAVTAINTAAEALLEISQVNFVGKPLTRLMHHFSVELPSDSEATERGSQHEFTIEKDPSGEPVQVVYHSRYLCNTAGQRTGSIYIFQDVTRLRSIESQLEMQERMARLLAEEHKLPGHRRANFETFVGNSPVMRTIFELIERVARTDATVLITGESGTGKELVAKSIHARGSRANGPFVAVNCGAIPESLLESQLFGHKRGSFTGADSDFNGFFRQAEGGTLFLDEVGELPQQMQAKMLRAIQEKTVRPIGGDRDIPVNVRIISATNRQLKEDVKNGRFREDFFYRLNVVNIPLPPLRQRKDDIPLLVNAFLRKFVLEDDKITLSPQVMQLLINYDYPGNVRELENILERAVVLGGSVILPEHLPSTVSSSKNEEMYAQETKIIVDDTLVFPVDLESILNGIERRYLEAALVQSDGVKKRAAEILGINFRSLRYRLSKFGME